MALTAGSSDLKQPLASDEPAHVSEAGVWKRRFLVLLALSAAAASEVALSGVAHSPRASTAPLGQAVQLSAASMEDAWSAFMDAANTGDFESYLSADATWHIVVESTGKTVDVTGRTKFFNALNSTLAALGVPDQHYAQSTIGIDGAAKVAVLAWQAADFGSSTDIYFFDDSYALRRMVTNFALCPLPLCTEG